MTHRKHKPIGSPLKFFAALETERINGLLEAADSPHRLTVANVFEMLCSCDWKCQDTGVFYAVERCVIVWIDPIQYSIEDNLRIVAESQEQYYISWDVLHKHSWASKAA